MEKSVILSFLLILFLFSISYFFILSFGIFSQPKKLKEIGDQTKPLQIMKEGMMYYPNMKFNHNLITYYIDESCNQEKEKRVEEAMSILEREVGLIKFIKTKNNNSDIEIICNKVDIPLKNKNYFIQGEGGPISIINTSLFFVIEKGVIFLFYDKPPCEEPLVELHELLHVFGFEHSQNKKSIMYPVLNCDQQLTPDIINKMEELYNIDNLPDLYFENISVYKKGIFIDFNLNVKNQGLIDGKNVKIKIYTIPQNKFIEEFDLETISFGGGKFLEVKNLKLPFYTKEIKFEINDGEELNYDNNIKIFSLE